MADEDRQAEFARRGFTVVDLLTPEEVESWWAKLQSLSGGAFAATPQEGRSFAFHSSFLHDDIEYRRRTHHLISEALQPKLDGIVPGYEILLAGLFLKAPGTGHVPLHFDWTMVPDLSVVGINVWCPLVDVTPENGALHLVEGSQRAVPHIGAPGTPLWCAGLQEELSAMAVPIPLRAGQALVYDNTILHWSPPNRSQSPRPVMGVNCLPRAVSPVFYRPDPDSDGARFEKFDMSGGAYFETQAGRLFSGELAGRSLGFVANPNRTLGREEVLRLIRSRLGQARRRRFTSALGTFFSRGDRSVRAS